MFCLNGSASVRCVNSGIKAALLPLKAAIHAMLRTMIKHGPVFHSQSARPDGTSYPSRCLRCSLERSLSGQLNPEARCLSRFLPGPGSIPPCGVMHLFDPSTRPRVLHRPGPAMHILLLFHYSSCLSSVFSHRAAREGNTHSGCKSNTSTMVSQPRVLRSPLKIAAH